MFAAYGDVAPYTRALADTLAVQAAAGGTTPHPVRVAVALGEIAGEHPDPRAWASAVAGALDALDDPTPIPAPMTRPTDDGDALSNLEKIQRLRRTADIGIGAARALLEVHRGDLSAALASIDQGKSAEQRARDKAGDFVAGLVNPTRLAPRPPWQVLLDAAGIEYGEPFPAADVLLRSDAPAENDVRIHARLLGESVDAGTVSWEPGWSALSTRG
jgi:hypothetical protein